MIKYVIGEKVDVIYDPRGKVRAVVAAENAGSGEYYLAALCGIGGAFFVYSGMHVVL
ncbi:hypothetical protein JJV70_04270 [Streptomyces sp. JJ66]|nr:hypothetical protein [Streptomyces sp. JJ66]MBW1601330.1 hypothetical protein [Streptomyces sp. JJ66]